MNNFYATIRRALERQSVRDASLLAALALVAVLDYFALLRYFSSLEKPLLIAIGFLGSLAISCLYEFKGGVPWRVGLTGSLANGIAFCAGASIARWIRGWYIESLAQVKDLPEFAAWVGHDLHVAMSTKMVGHGGCLAVGLLLARLTVGNETVRKWLRQVFIADSNRTLRCPCCGQDRPNT